MRFIRANEITTPPCVGTAPPQRPVPAPRATIGAPQAFAIRTVALTSRTSLGITAALGDRPSV